MNTVRSRQESRALWVWFPFFFVAAMLPAGLGACASSPEDGTPTPLPATSTPGETTAPVTPTQLAAESPSPTATEASCDATPSSCPSPTAVPGHEPNIINPSIHNTVLGRPTNASIAISVLASAPGDKAFIEYSRDLSEDFSALAGQVWSTDPVSSPSGEPMVFDLRDLHQNTRYYYRVQYQSGTGPYSPDNIHSFMTQRPPGSVFRFGVQGDTHPERYNNKMFSDELMTLTMAQARDRQPDFYFMLGDDFSIERIVQDFKEANYEAGYPFTKALEGTMPYDQYLATILHPFDPAMIVDGKSAPAGNAAYLELRERYLGTMANATSLFLVNGNHELAHSASLGGIFNNAAVWAADARLKYYALPAPDGFYSGDDLQLYSYNGYPSLQAEDGLLRDYYAFTWGDALFVTIDPYWHSDLVSPDSSVYNGDEDVDKWAATMGDAQYFWLKDTLENSDARWKFVFAHHINGDGRGGAACVGVQEWGGKVSDFEARRPTWEKPIHPLLVDTGVTIFFQGHDHIFSREVVDGVIYQSVPSPADNSYFAYNCTAYDPATIEWKGLPGYGIYDPDYGVVMPNAGFLNVTVAPERVTVEYIRTYRQEDLEANPNSIFDGSEVNGETAFSYSLPALPEDDQAADFAYPCLGDAPPNTWVYIP